MIGEINSFCDWPVRPALELLLSWCGGDKAILSFVIAQLVVFPSIGINWLARKKKRDVCLNKEPSVT